MKKKRQFPFVLIGPIITLCIMLIIYAAAGVFPFGGATTAFSDGIAQYIPFLAELSDKIRNGGSLFFSWHAGNGINFWANIAYYLMSPLNLLAVLFPIERMDDAFSLITLIKPMLMALTFGLYLKYSYKKSDWSTAIFSVLWAMSGFMIGAYFFTSWMDAVIYFPLVILGLKNMMEGKSAWLYSLFLGLTIASNFYIGWMVCIFCIIYFIYCFIADDDVTYEGVSAGADEEQPSDDSSVNIFAVFKNSYLLGSFFKFVFSSLLAGGFSAIMTLPAFMALQKTGKGTVTPETFNVDIEGIAGLLASHIMPFKNNYSTLGARDCIFAFVGIASIILCVSYFFAKGISLRKKFGNLFLLAVFWISIALHDIYFVWHGFGEPVGVMYRFAFIYSFVLLKIAYEAFVNIKNIPIYGILSGTLFSAICISCVYFSNLFNVMFFSSKLIALLAAFTVVFTVLLVLITKKIKLKNTLSVVLLLCVIIESVLLNYGNLNTLLVSENLSENKVVEELTKNTEEYDRVFFQSEKQSYKDMMMYGQIFGFNALESYTSMCDNNFSLTVTDLGSYGNRLNSQNGADEQNPVFNMVFPTDYYIDGSGRLTENSFRQKISETDGYTLFKNNYTMPFMYSVSKDIVEWDPFQFPIHLDNLNAVATALTGTQENIVLYNSPENFVFENCKHISSDERAARTEEENHEHEHSESTNDGGLTYYGYLEERMSGYSYEISDMTKPVYITYDSVAAADGIMYLYVDTNELVDLTVTINGKTTQYYLFGKGDGRTYELGEVKKGDVAEIKIGGYRENGLDGEDIYLMKNGNFTTISYTVDMDKFEKAYQKLDAMSDTEMLEFEDTYVKAKVTSYEDGMLYIPTAYDEGWTITIDGEEVPLYEHESHILMTEISKGEHIVEMKYVPQGFIPGAVITGVSVLILIAWAVISTKRFKKEQESDIIVSNDVNEE